MADRHDGPAFKYHIFLCGLAVVPEGGVVISYIVGYCFMLLLLLLLRLLTSVKLKAKWGFEVVNVLRSRYKHWDDRDFSAW